MSTTNAKRRTKSKPAEKHDAVTERVAALRRLAPSAIDEDSIRALVGDVRLRTLQEISRVFAVARNTIQTSWRQDGCPGTAGAYDVAEILAWLLQREVRRARGQRPSNGYAQTDMARRELADIEVEAARATLQIQQAKAQKLSGEYYSAEVIRSEWNALLGILSNDIMAIPRGIKPRLPAKVADDVIYEIDRQLRMALMRISELDVERLNKNASK